MTLRNMFDRLFLKHYMKERLQSDPPPPPMNFILEGKFCFTETERLCRITLIVYRQNKFLTSMVIKVDP